MFVLVSCQYIIPLKYLAFLDSINVTKRYSWNALSTYNCLGWTSNHKRTAYCQKQTFIAIMITHNTVWVYVSSRELSISLTIYFLLKVVCIYGYIYIHTKSWKIDSTPLSMQLTSKNLDIYTQYLESYLETGHFVTLIESKEDKHENWVFIVDSTMCRSNKGQLS